MIKTEQQIERDFFMFIKNSTLGKSVKGSVLRSGMREKDATTEDLVIKFLAGIDTQIQSGVVILNIYVLDTTYQGVKVEDKQRTGALEELILSFINSNTDTEYLLETDGTPTSMLNEQIRQHVIVARIKFNRLT